MVEIIIANEKNSSDWDRFVDNSADSTLFHKWEWLKTVEKYTNSTFYPLVGSEDGVIVGIFPLFLEKRFFIRSVFSPPPRTAIPYLGPVVNFTEEKMNYDKESSFIEFCSKIVEFLSSEIKPNYTRFAFTPNLYDLRPLIWAGYKVEPYYCYSMDITTNDPNYFLSRLKKKLRQGINMAIRSGVVIKEGKEQEFDKICELMERRYSEQDKIANVDGQYLKEIYGKFKKNINVWVAEYNEEIITGMIDLHYKGELASWIGNPKPEITDVHANDLLNWISIKWACDNGFDRYITIGAAGVQRLYSYYSKFNFKPLVSLTARKYSSPLFRFIESSYTNIIKPAKAKFKR